MPWQRLCADIAGEIDPHTGLPAYPEVFTTVPRQSGKTTLFLSWQLHRCISPRWVQPQRSVFTAQTGKDARDKWLDELFPLIKSSKLKPFVKQINQGMGNESVLFKTGGSIRLLSTSSSSGHSKTLDQAVLDEIWHDTDDRREQGLRPTMNTRADAQMLVCSTAGTNASTVYNRKRAAGRRAVIADSGVGLAYFEWSAPREWDPYDEDSYYGIMPALCPDPPCRCGGGEWKHTTLMPAVRGARESMELPEFIRAYGNRSTPGADLVLPEDVWWAVCDPTAKPSGRLRFGLDVAEDRSTAAITSQAGGVIELIEHRPGLDWVAQRCNELTDRHKGKVGLDFGGPAGVLADSIKEADRMIGRRVVQACGGMFDAITEGRVKFRSERGDAFDDAVLGVVKKPVGDQFVWSRKASQADVTPFMAASLAFAPGEKETKPFVAYS